MTDDLAFVCAHIPDYQAYGDEPSRHDSDQRVRAYVGQQLSQAQLRLADHLDEATQKTLDDVLLRCMFTDQVFIRKFEHARLEAPMLAAFVRSDRHLIELADEFKAATPESMQGLLVELDKLFEYRRAPEPVS